jgi:hypothetical protein
LMIVTEIVEMNPEIAREGEMMTKVGSVEAEATPPRAGDAMIAEIENGGNFSSSETFRFMISFQNISVYSHPFHAGCKIL